MSLLLLLPASLVGGILYRIRGGCWASWWPIPGTTGARLTWAAPTAALVWGLATSHGAPAWIIAPLVAAAFGGLALIGHAEVMWLGSEPWGYDGTPQNAWLVAWIPGIQSQTISALPRGVLDALALTLIGLVRGSLIGIPIAAWDPWLAAASAAGGACMGAAYVVGLVLPVTIPGFVAQQTERGEVLTGAAFWAALVGGAVLGA